MSPAPYKLRIGEPLSVQELNHEVEMALRKGEPILSAQQVQELFDARAVDKLKGKLVVKSARTSKHGSVEIIDEILTRVQGQLLRPGEFCIKTKDGKEFSSTCLSNRFFSSYPRR